MFSGIVGMVLATIIRLEMAYPGVGILAGDSLQYLSVVTAHAVVMVFFMIMPLMFGAFGNFLLPTQLGVHDVAFPRLNSAAFWFLPAGLIMLCQLVCLDRRYQRMNCFNIREVQSLLKSRYFNDLINMFDHHWFLESTALGIRFKTNGIDVINPNILIVLNHGLVITPTNRTQQYLTSNEQVIGSYTLLTPNTLFNYIIGVIDNSNIFNLQGFTSQFSVLYTLINTFFDKNVFKNLYNLFGTSFLFDVLYTLPKSFTLLLQDALLLLSNLFNNNINLLSSNTVFNNYINNLNTDLTNWSLISLNNKVLTSEQEISHNFRHQKFSNPIFSYDYKIGDYLPEVMTELYPYLFTSISEVTGGIRKSAWFFSPVFVETFKADFTNYYSCFITPQSSNPEIQSSTISNTYGFYNFFYCLTDSTNYINHRWLSINAIDQKFYRMFATSSMQQRIYSNWRQLKFTREAWRCKLLSARHQKTLYRRYLNEEGLFWAVERNAKDVLPGWAMITPFSARTRFTAIGKVDIGLMGVFLVLNSSIVSSANFLVTYRYLSTLNNRKMRDARSFFTEGVMVASWMMIAANPMLAIGILMLLSDRHWQTSFFDYSGGGDTVLFQHMFWFFGHPEVYVIMIPAFGFNNTILSFYLRKRVSARASLMYSMYTIAFLGFFVWGHHMYMVGLAHTTRMLFSTLTVMISVPAATKLMHWCVTLVNSSFWVELPFLFTLLFIFFFVSGGISGMAVAHTGMDILFHDSFYVIGHFHVMFAGAAMFASFGAFYFYFPSIFGVKFSRIWGYLHITYFLLGQLMTVIPMFWLGYSGMPRRVLDYPASLGGWHAIVSAGHLLSVAGIMAFFIMIFDSLRQGRAATRNSFGISRFNTRFNFYLYEIARIRFVQRKGWYISKYNTTGNLELNYLDYNNIEVFETTLYSYALIQLDEVRVYETREARDQRLRRERAAELRNSSNN
jgi:heme/copper-type cytochrome/quinol oxidase subunit 1